MSTTAIQVSPRWREERGVGDIPLAGRSLYDLSGREFTLLRLDPSVDVAPFLEAASARRLPLDLLDIDLGGIPSPYRHPLCIARPDFHVGWRGNQTPAQPEHVLAKLSGGR